MMTKLLVACSLVFAAFSAQSQTPTHQYLLDGSFADSLGGPALVDMGGTLGATGYSFAANQGLNVAGAVNASVYTIDLSFAFAQVDGYRRIIDFLNLSSDTGLYALSSALNFYNLTTGPAAAFTAGQMARVTVTRDAGGLFTGYVDGVAQLVFNDSSALAVFSGPAQIAYFFRDDSAVGGEASAGFVDYIRIYDSALTASEVANLPLPSAVPEAGTWILMLAGTLAVLRRARRR